MSALLELAERCEKATGPDRELDWLIADALGEIPEHSIAATGTPYGWFRRPDEFSLWQTKESDPRAGVDLWQPKNCTAFLDAAMTLVPEGMHGQVQFGNRPGAWVGTEGEDAADFNVAATPALALCAAALRAKAAAQ